MAQTLETTCAPDEAALTFYKREDGVRRVRLLIGGSEAGDLLHDGTMHMELDKALTRRGLARTEGFRLRGGELVAQVRSTGGGADA